jgi:hypothetical protein
MHMLTKVLRIRRPAPARRLLNLESLADRALPSANPIHLAHGVLAIHGTQASDVVTVKVDAANSNQLDVFYNNPNTPAATFALSKVKKIAFSGGPGNDTFTNDTSIPCVAHAGKGDDVLIGGTGHNVLIGGSGTDTLIGGPHSNVLQAGNGTNTLHGGLGTNVFMGGKHTHIVANGHGKNIIHGAARLSESSTGDLVATLTDANGNEVGTAEISTETDANGVVHTDVQVEIEGAPANVTLTLTVDPDGTGAHLFALGTVTTDSEGEAEFEAVDPANFPTVTTGAGTLTASDAPGGTDVFKGTFVNMEASTGLAAQLTDSAGFTVGQATFDPSQGQFDLQIGGAPANTMYTVNLNGVAVGTFTTDGSGFGELHVTAGASFPSLQAGSTITVTNAAGATVLTGTFQQVSGDGGGDNNGDNGDNGNDDGNNNGNNGDGSGDGGAGDSRVLVQHH